MKYFYMIRNNGDGSSSIEFVKDEEVQKLLAEKDPEAYADGDGSTDGFLEIATNDEGSYLTHNGSKIDPTSLEEAQKLLADQSA